MNIGGQAVIEGVMMRNQERFAVAVRLPNGKIKVKKEKNAYFPSFFRIPFIRGVVGLGYQLVDGIKALVWSSNQQLGKKEKINTQELIVTIGISIIAALTIFVIIPFFAAHLIYSEGIWFNVLDGVVRISLFMGYLLIISFMKDVKTLFKYHGAEHKTIYCYEAKQQLTVKNVKKFSRFHPRCGTSFIFLVLLISVFLFSFITGSWWIKLVGRIALLPVIAAMGYEAIKLSGRFQNNLLVKIIIAPGLWLQRLTTKEPTDRQLEVGITSLKAVISKA